MESQTDVAPEKRRNPKPRDEKTRLTDSNAQRKKERKMRAQVRARGCKARDFPSKKSAACDVIGNPDSVPAKRLLMLIQGFLFLSCQRLSQGRKCNKRRFMARKPPVGHFDSGYGILAEFFACRFVMYHVTLV